MISYTVGYGPKYTGRSFVRMRDTSPILPRRRAGACPPPPAPALDHEWLAGMLFIITQALIVGLAVIVRA